MLRGRRKSLAILVLCAISSMGLAGYASAEDGATEGAASRGALSSGTSGETLSTHSLMGITVEGDQDTLSGGMASTRGTMGFLGDRDMMDIPFSEVTLTQKTIEMFGGPNQPTQSILINNPAVRVEGTTLHNDISIRGLNQTGTSIYLNGIPGLNGQFTAPYFAIGQVQFISGPNSGLTSIPATAETSTAGGIVNFVTKKAGDEPLTRYRQVFTGESTFAEYVDVGRRFGDNKEWGLRFNAEIANGDTAIDGHNMRAQGFALNLDHEDEFSKTNFYTSYRHQDIRGGMRWFRIGSNVTKIPGAPEAGNDYGFDGMRKEGEGFIMALNHEQKIDDEWKWFFNAGFNRHKLKNNVTGQSSSVTIINNDGDVSNNIMSSQSMMENYYAQIGVNGKVQTGEVEHDLTIAAEKAWHTLKSSRSSYSGQIGTITGNIYTGIIANGFWKPPVTMGLSSKDQYWGLTLVDTMKYKKSQFLIGVHKHSSTINSYSTTTGNLTSTVSSDDVSPTYGYMYQPNDHVSVYASHSEQFDAGEVVGSAYENAGEILSPAKTKQNEIGVKYKNGGMMIGLAFFDIEQANNFSVEIDGLDYYLQDGKQKNRGIELSINGKIAPKWNIMGGFLYLDAEQRKTQGGINDGKTVNGKSRWSAVAALEYEANEDFSVIGRMFYNGRTDMANETLSLPSYVTFDLGVNYRTKINDIPVTLSAMCYNVADRNYWTPHGSGMLLSTPRTFLLSASFDF